MAHTDWKNAKTKQFERRIVIYEPSEYHLEVIKTLESIALKILYLFGEKLRDDNTVESSTLELAAELGRSPRQTRQGLGALQRADFVQKRNGGKTYKVNPGIFRVAHLSF